ncbi:MAG: TrkA family potassium uptake protein [Deltaproteobacteria bacterium]|nr:MAG: TrkA family potassium uptake protein [Deltaproteobacteria bacterium]
MGKFAVIGLGNFGFNVAKTLHENGHEVVGIDRNKERAQRLQRYSSQTIIADATDKSILETVGFKDMDAVVVSLGDDLSSSILVTLFLRDIGVKNIIVKIMSEDHGRALEKIGATEIVFPERDTAVKLAKSLSSPNILDYLPLSPEYSIMEVAPPKEFIGKSLAQLHLRSKFNVSVIAVKELIPDRMTINPTADFVVKDSDILIVLGKRKDIEKLK